MNSKEFVIWLKGFVAAANEYNITPKQFEQIVEQLSKVSDTPNMFYGSTITGVPNFFINGEGTSQLTKTNVLNG